MTATNHALAGALIAMAVKQPILAVPLAFASHFLLDAIPHFGLREKNVKERNRQSLFWRVLLVDMVLASLLLVIIPLLLHPQVNGLLVVACMAVATSPDLVWGYRLYFEKVHNRFLPKRMFSRMHTAIQWSETPPGMITEVLWFVLANLIIVGYALGS